MTTRLISLTAAALVAGGCLIEVDFVDGSGRRATEARHVAPFERLEVSDGIDTAVTLGARQQVQVSTDDNLLYYLRTEVSGDTLSVDVRGIPLINWRHAPQADVAVPTLRHLSAFAGTTLHAAPFDGETLRLVAGAGSTLRVQGVAADLDVDLSAGSHLDAQELEARDVVVRASAGSVAEVCVLGRLTVYLSGGSRVDVYCNPTLVVEGEMSGGSSVRR